MVQNVFSLPGSWGRNLTDLPPRSISTGVYVGIHISQGKIHYVPFVLALRRNRIRESDVVCTNTFFFAKIGFLDVSR